MSDAADRWSVDLAGATLLGRYRVERPIGGGGMGSVYLAHDEQLEIPVVVKVPHAAFLAEPGFRERFDRETRDLVALEHPHVVRILARGEHEGLPFLVMSFLRGGSLGDRMGQAGGAMAFESIVPWVRDVGRALDFIHAQGVVHRDIKPDNVLFDEHGHAFLSDFGIAKAVGGADTGLTMTGATPGSPAYMAPEQARTNELTGQSDQYAFAATLYEALSGKPTFEGETVVDVLIQKQAKMPEDLAAVAPAVPAPAAAAIMRALARLPDERFASCTALVDAMLAPAGATPAAKPSAPPPREPTVALGSFAPTPTPEPAPATTSVGATTRTGGGVSRALWLLLVAVLAVPLAILVAPGDDGGPGDERATARDTGGDVKIFTPEPGPEPGPEPAAAVTTAGEAVAGDYELDREALEARLRDMRAGRPSMPRMAAILEDLERAARQGMSLTLAADGSFRMVPPTRDGKPQREMTGTWTRTGDVITLEPDEASAPVPTKRGGGVFQMRVEDDGTLLFQVGRAALPLRRR